MDFTDINMLSKILKFVKDHQEDIILLIGVILISLFSFALGYIVAKRQNKEPIKIEYHDSNILIHTNDTNNELVQLVLIRILASI